VKRIALGKQIREVAATLLSPTEIYTRLKLHGQGFGIAAIFWGLWLFSPGPAHVSLALHSMHFRSAADPCGLLLAGRQSRAVSVAAVRKRDSHMDVAAQERRAVVHVLAADRGHKTETGGRAACGDLTALVLTYLHGFGGTMGEINRRNCDVEQARGSGATSGASKHPEDGRTTMLIQGVSTRDCPGNRSSKAAISNWQLADGRNMAQTFRRNTSYRHRGTEILGTFRRALTRFARSRLLKVTRHREDRRPLDALSDHHPA
jgi:hypothetical protein